MAPSKKSKVSPAAQDVLNPVALYMMDENVRLDKRIRELEETLKETRKRLKLKCDDVVQVENRLRQSEGERLELDWKCETYEEILRDLMDFSVVGTRLDVAATISRISRDGDHMDVSYLVNEVMTPDDLFTNDDMDEAFRVEERDLDYLFGDVFESN